MSNTSLAASWFVTFAFLLTNASLKSCCWKSFVRRLPLDVFTFALWPLIYPAILITMGLGLVIAWYNGQLAAIFRGDSDGGDDHAH